MTPAPALLVLVLAAAAAAAPPEDDPAPGAPAGEPARNLVFLAEERPIFLRLRVTTGDRPLDSAWADSVRALHAWLDRDGDGMLSTKEADPTVLAALVRLATGDASALPGGPGENQQAGTVSADDLSEALRPVLGPFRVQVGRLANGRTDALFDHLDRDKDEQLTRSELAAIAGSLRKLDLDDNEMIAANELEPFNSPGMTQAGDTADRRARYTALPPVVERVVGESSLRLARLLLKKYDKGRGDVPGRPDGKLSRAELTIDTDAFSDADANGDEELNTEELRRFLSRAPTDLVLNVTFPADAPGQASVRVGGDGVLPKGTQVRQLGDGDVEIAIGQIRLDLHVDGGDKAAENARRVLLRRFQVADANKDGYLEGKELAVENAQAAPLAGLTQVIDRDGDGKLYAKELVDFTDHQTAAAQGCVVLTVSDQGRAIFGILDLDRDRRLSAREVMRTVDRITSWDGDRDGRVTADEIPYHFLVNVSRGELAGLAGGGTAANAAVPDSGVAPRLAGPEWFRQMDRNKDRDISHREFLGPRAQFDRLDRDKDGLIDAEEAGAAAEAAKPKASAGDAGP